MLYAGDWKADRLSKPPGRFLGGRRRLRTILDIIRENIRMKPRMRMVHSNLRKVISLLGKTADGALVVFTQLEVSGFSRQ